MSNSSRAKPKFHFRRDGQRPAAPVLDTFPSADSAFILLHPFYRLSVDDFALLLDNEVQVDPPAGATAVSWSEIMTDFELPSFSKLRWLTYALTDGILARVTETEVESFRSRLAAERIICPVTCAPPPSLASLALAAGGGEPLTLERPETPGWCRYTSTGELFLVCFYEEPFSYLAGVRPVVQAAVEQGSLEGFFVDGTTPFDW